MITPFDSPGRLQDSFASGLEELLNAPGLGAYILVLANALFDEKLAKRLQPALEQRYLAHLARIRERLGSGRETGEAPDDLLVFLKLAAIGPDALGVTERRAIAPWEIQFNLLRSFRPQRMSARVGGGIQIPFNPDGFHFNKPFLRKETIWAGELAGRPVDLLYNKFPFVDLHGLLVPDRQAEQPQFLAQDWHEYIWCITRDLSRTLPGLGFGYNSYGAHASVNHLHFQMFLRDAPLPVACDHWHHNGGHEPYPACCLRFDDPEAAWRHIDQLHQKAQPYNLVYLPGRVYCLSRARQGEIEPAAWRSGFAWYEMAGGLIAFNREDYEGLDAGQMQEELRRIGWKNKP